MRAYRIMAETDDGFHTAFAGSNGDATKKRMEMAEALGIKKSAIDIAVVEIPTDKVGLLTYLNSLGLS